MAQYAFEFPLPNGLHARPASHLVEAAARCRAPVTFTNERTGRSADAQSVLALVATDTRQGDPCRLAASGDQAEETVASLRAYVAGDFRSCDEPLALEPTIDASAVLIPRALRAAGLVDYFPGQIASRGCGVGLLVSAGGFALPANLEAERASSAAAEHDKFTQALHAVLADLDAAAKRADHLEAAVLSAHRAIIQDPALTRAIRQHIDGGATAGQAVARAVEGQRQMLLKAESAYIRERALDVEDLAGRLWARLYGPSFTPVAPALREPSLVIAESLTPSQFLALDRRWVQGIALAKAGQTSHAVILARSFGIPTLTGVAVAPAAGHCGGRAVLDANVGVLIPRPPAEVLKFYDRQLRNAERMASACAVVRDQPAKTRDGQRLEVGANIASVEEARAAFAGGAEGIGLFRTELLFADRTAAPSEQEQYELYAAVLTAAAGRPVIIRTLDIGGDKPVPFLTFPAEANPFLGYRGVRFYAEHADLVKTQLRALLRASAHGLLKILVPMVATVEEARVVRRLLDEARAELAARGEAVAPAVPLGLMLEVPSVAFALDELCAEAEFFSLGTNDLAQYFFAADRENARVGALNDPFQPAFVRLLQHLVSGVRARGRWIGLCGELAEKSAALPLLVGLGLDEISLAAPRIAATKAAIAQLDAGRCREFLAGAVAAATREALQGVLAAPPREPLPLLAPELVLLDLEATTKAEAIRALVDELHVQGRTVAPTLVEEAVWRREETYSTGFGDGFALPHCQSDALAAHAIAVARLHSPVEWQAMDGQPVDLIILLAVRAAEHGKAHMRILARLSRLLANDDFRAALRRAGTTAEIIRLLSQAAEA